MYVNMTKTDKGKGARVRKKVRNNTPENAFLLNVKLLVYRVHYTHSGQKLRNRNRNEDMFKT